MYAIIETGGKQYKVQEGELIFIEKLIGEEGDTVTFDKVLAISNEGSLNVGNPLLSDATVTAKIVKHGKDKKIIVFKYKAKKGYRRKQGHRQPYTKVEIEFINEDMKMMKAKKAAKSKEEAAEMSEETTDANIEETAVENIEETTAKKTKKTTVSKSKKVKTEVESEKAKTVVEGKKAKTEAKSEEVKTEVESKKAKTEAKSEKAKTEVKSEKAKTTAKSKKETAEVKAEE